MNEVSGQRWDKHVGPAEVDAQGHYGSRNNCLVTLRFTNIHGLKLWEFNEQNVLFSLHFEAVDPEIKDGRRWKVSLHESYGLGGKFLCDAIAVQAVERL